MPRRTDDVMNLRALKCFLVTAQCGSLTKAGVDLNLCEAAVSERVRSLETWLGVKLYEKHGGGVQLTAAGERTVQAAVTLFREIEALEEALRVPPYIVKGQTTRTHVLLTLGEPDLRAQDGAWFAYYEVGRRGGMHWAVFAAFSHAGAERIGNWDTETRLTINFDEKGLVADVSLYPAQF